MTEQIEAILEVMEEVYPQDLTVKEIADNIKIDEKIIEPHIRELVDTKIIYVTREIGGFELYIFDMLKKGVDYFNNHKFFESHDVIEEIWHSEIGLKKNYYRGLVNLGVAFRHFQLKNYKSCLLIIKHCLRLLEPYIEDDLRIDLKILLKEIQICMDEIQEVADEKKKYEEIIIPKMKILKHY